MPMVHEFDRRTGKADLLLAGHGVLRAQLSDPYAVVPVSRYLAIFEQAAEFVGDATFGAQLGTTMKPGDIGPMGMLFSMAPTIRRAFERLSRFVNALQGATQSSLGEQDDALVWSYAITDRTLWPRRQDSEFTLATTCHLVRQCFASAWRPKEVHFEHGEPLDAKVLKRLFQAPLLFGQSANRIVLEKADADRVHRQEDAALVAILERHIADLVGDAGEAATVGDQVTALIGMTLGYRPITLAMLASELGMTARTLQRRLSDEGTSVRDLLRAYRISLAEEHGREVRGSRSRLASALGYADTTALWRARKNWKTDG